MSRFLPKTASAAAILVVLLAAGILSIVVVVGRLLVVDSAASYEGTFYESPDGNYVAAMSAREGPSFWGDYFNSAEFTVADKQKHAVFVQAFVGDDARLVCSRRGWARIVWSDDSHRVLFYAPKEFPPDTTSQLVLRVDLRDLSTESRVLPDSMPSEGFEQRLKDLVESR